MLFCLRCPGEIPIARLKTSNSFNSEIYTTKNNDIPLVKTYVFNIVLYISLIGFHAELPCLQYVLISCFLSHKWQNKTKENFLPCPIHKDRFRRDTTWVNFSTNKKKTNVKRTAWHVGTSIGDDRGWRELKRNSRLRFPAVIWKLHLFTAENAFVPVPSCLPTKKSRGYFIGGKSPVSTVCYR